MPACNFRFGAQPEHEDEHGIERDLGDRIAEDEQRLDQRLDRPRARHGGAEEHANGERQRKSQQRPVERD
jgi:hypothetical protein